ncbi:MAG: hypothetical protein QM770_13375 [Tepidisphaeraceae bacterium]
MDQEEFFTSPLANLLTMNDIARRLEVPLATVKNVIEKHAIHATKRHGVIRLWHVSNIRLIRQYLAAK